MTKLKVGMISLGCNKNRVDSETALGLLREHGYELTNDPAQADVLMVNTCGFIASAKEESIDAILDMARYKQIGKCRALVVTGCLAQRYEKDLMQEIPEIDLLMGVNQYQQLPDALIESAKIDGASEYRICFSIVLPLSVPAMATIGFLYFVGKWNDWMTCVYYINKPALYSLQYLLQRILREAEFLKQLSAEQQALEANTVVPTESFRFAMVLLAAGPVLVVFPFFQKYFSKGMTIGAVKG